MPTRKRTARQLRLDEDKQSKLRLEEIAQRTRNQIEVEKLRLNLAINKDMAHAQLATRVYRYKYSFAPCKSYQEISEDLGVITGNFLQSVTTRVRNLRLQNFHLVHDALRKLEIELGLPEMPQSFWKE